ncbi:MAG: translocase [Planctomycetales bacterium]|nr:translocase [Planctomycetales bacterium]MBN8629071.1 preprotein translocase subunit SecA [Planctomycetota bacterium]
MTLTNVLARFRGSFDPAARTIERINAWESTLEALSDAELRERSLSLKFRARSGTNAAALIPEAYAVIREACRRTLGMRHYDTQLRGGVALARNCLAEIQTGEGKTLTAALPLYLHALAGKGAQLATVNDYLAERDCGLLRRPLESLGLSVGLILTSTDPELRRRAYRCDITYGTGKEFGFDFLKDRLAMRAADEQGAALTASTDRLLQRPPHFALVDEADCVLIDDAVTPLIIGAGHGVAAQTRADVFRWAATAVDEFEEDRHFVADEQDRRDVVLTAEGCQHARLLEKPDCVDLLGVTELYEFIERAIRVAREFHRDVHYIVSDNEIVIIDEFTGRAAEGRRWQAGIHEALEAKEGLEIRVNEGHAARVTVQHFFLRFPHLAGMTGTIASSRREVRVIYKLRTVVIPTHRPTARKLLPTRIFATARDKWQAIVDEVRDVVAGGRPVLIGTKSIDKSETLSDHLRRAGIAHEVLNARHVAREAAIVAEAGHQGRVTVATNMAGRGTDIKLPDEVLSAGGLHVIATEFHDARRIDRQLVGRCGRQGDPGSFRQYLALDDEIFKNAYSPRVAARIAARGARYSGRLDRCLPWFRRAQRKVELRMMRGRKGMLHREHERKKTYDRIGFDYYLDCPE